MIKLYLAHNFNIRKQIRKWELKMEGKYNIILDNPFYDHDRNDIKSLDKLEDDSPEQVQYFKERNTLTMVDSIVEGDLELIRKADGLVTRIKSPSIGTSMEIFFASRILRIPVYIITKAKLANHPWIKKHSTVTFNSMADFENFVEKNWGRKR